MAKGDKKSKKDKDKVKIPKRIAGVKVSKAVRQAERGCVSSEAVSGVGRASIRRPTRYKARHCA